MLASEDALALLDWEKAVRSERQQAKQEAEGSLLAHFELADSCAISFRRSSKTYHRLLLADCMFHTIWSYPYLISPPRDLQNLLL